MWITRNKDNHVRLHTQLPSKTYSHLTVTEDWASLSHSMPLNTQSFPELTWEDEPLKVEIDTRENLIKRLEILHVNYYQDSNKYMEENPGKGYMSFDEYALKHWDNVDMNYFNTIG